ncbi:MAG TPA: glycosyl hydrolase family 65 protein [Polyangia bacterium]
MRWRSPAPFPEPLLQRFRVIAFDWDGTAVVSRREEGREVRGLIERLLRAGVSIVVITGTSFDHVDRQLSSEIRGHHKRELYVATNRGSEVFGFDAESRPTPLFRRDATPEEEAVLTAVAEAVRDQARARWNLEIGIVYDRLNRRKIDIIPVPEWADPPKSAIGHLLTAVEERLRRAGVPGGIRELFGLTERLAAEMGLPRARITSDVKHIELGLTDKADAITWMMRELVDRRGVARHELLIAGDEFGPIGGFPGSDYKMITPEAEGAVFASVGPEPHGAPPPVIHLGGGPQRFKELLRYQASLHPLAFPAGPTADPEWLLVEPGFHQAREHEIESLFALGNGYLGTRASLAEGSQLSAPATFVAGVFETTPETGAAGVELARAWDWANLRAVVDGRALALGEGEALEHRRVLDVRKGMLWREWRHRDPAGRVTHLKDVRLASQHNRHLMLQSVLIQPENYTGKLLLETRRAGAAAGGSTTPAQPVQLTRRTSGTAVTVSLAVAETVESLRGEAPARHQGAVEDDLVDRWELEVELGGAYRLDRQAALHTSRDTRRPAEAASRDIERLLDEGVAAAIHDHVAAWEERWRASDVRVAGDAAAQRAMRFAVYHLISAANPDDEHVSIGARGLTGEAYKGHVFWDTEVYMLPFYTFTHPRAARALLMYRYHTLAGARHKASQLGYRGALYAWESADSGEEVTPSWVVGPDGNVIRVLSGEQEHHISSAVAYGAWSYWQATGDDDFFVNAGAEILLETARFWATRGDYGDDGRYHISTVIGPDEYHESVDDSAYTNGMAQWNLRRGLATAELLAERWPAAYAELAARLRLDAGELDEWRRAADAMYTGFDPATGLYEEFRGYFGLEDIDIKTFEPRTAPLDMLLGRERTQASQVVKQADVVLLLYLLWDELPPEVRETNFRYYEPRTGHGSSLSPAIHALVAARLGDTQTALRYFRQSGEIDLANNMGNAAGGVHAAALGGLWQAAVFGFGGMHLTDAGPEFRPHLPPPFEGLEFPVEHRGRKLHVRIEGHPPELVVTSREE